MEQARNRAIPTSASNFNRVCDRELRGQGRQLLLARAPRGLLRQLTLIYTARANLILHDFIREVFWLKYASRAGEVTKQDACDFIEKAVSRGALKKPWSDSMVERVTRYLLGTLVDFELIASNQFGQRPIKEECATSEFTNSRD